MCREGDNLKKAWIMIFEIIVLALAACGNVESPVSQPPEKNIKIVGTVTDEFKNTKWRNYENINIIPSFNKTTIDKFDCNNYTVVDAYNLYGNTIMVTENKNGEIEYFKMSGDELTITHIPDGDVLDKFLLETISEGDEIWGFQKLNSYFLIIKNNCTEIYRDYKLVEKINGIAKMQDIDGDGKLELICDVDGNSLEIYRLGEKKLLKLWELKIQGESLNGNIQIGDLNNDGIKEIYIGDTSGSMRKFILTSNGLAEDNRISIGEKGKATGDYFLADYNNDGKCDVIVSIKNHKPQIFINNK